MSAHLVKLRTRIYYCIRLRRSSSICEHTMHDWPSRKALPISLIRSIAAVLAITLGWAICTVAQVEKYLGVPRGLAFTFAGAVCAALLILGLRRLFLAQRDFERWTPWCALAVLFLSFATLYPRSLHHPPRSGSDREDALRVELRAVTHHQYPYAARTFLKHPPTPLPGAMWLAAPFYAAGRIALQNLFWAVLFVFFLRGFFTTHASTAAFLILFLLTALENLNDFDVGGDYLTNVLYIVVAIALLVKAIDGRLNAWQTALSILLMGVALPSRALYAVILPPLLSYGLLHGKGKRTLALLGGAVFISICVTVPVFWPHPIQNFAVQLSQNADKLRLLPTYLPPRYLTALAFVVASLGILRRSMDLADIFGLAGAAMLILLLPPMAMIVRAEGGWTALLTPDLEYLSPAALFLALWALFRWEQDSFRMKQAA